MGRAVLIVEDQVLDREVMARFLTARGYDVSQAGSVAEACGRMYEHRPDIVLSDLMMPGADGWDLLRAMSADPHLCDVPVVFITAALDLHGEIARKAVACGVRQIIEKPVWPDEVAGVVERILGGGG